MLELLRVVTHDSLVVLIDQMCDFRCNCRGVEYDAPVARYYERLAAVQARGTQASHQVLRDILREVRNNINILRAASQGCTSSCSVTY